MRTEYGGDPADNEGGVVDDEAVSPGLVGGPAGQDTPYGVGNTQAGEKECALGATIAQTYGTVW